MAPPLLVAGVDEAGRGPIAGPVVAAACILPPHFPKAGLHDSKCLSERRREELFSLLTKTQGVFYSIQFVHAEIIDKINILQATLRAMGLAVSALQRRPDRVIVDGPHIPKELSGLAEGIVRADATFPEVSAASILAKVARDRWMVEVDREWPQYGFAGHKGYPTKQHRTKLREWGLCPIHRRSYAPCRAVLGQEPNPKEEIISSGLAP